MEQRQKQTFNSGVCSVWGRDDADVPKPKHSGLRFENRVVGIKRHYAAANTQYSADRLIRTPTAPGITTHDVVVIGDQQYEITQVQLLEDTAPPCLALTLHQLERSLFWEEVATDGR